MAFKNLSIRTKLLLLVILASTSALLLPSITLVVNDMRMTRDSFERQLLSLAEVLGANSAAALSFEDVESATEVLSSLRLQNGIEMGCIYNQKGQLFAKYVHDGQPPSKPPDEMGSTFGSDGRVEVAQRIRLGNDPIGVLYIQATMAGLTRQMLIKLGVAAIVMLLSLGSALMLCSRLQRQIAMPIVELASAAKHVSDVGDYSIRVTKTANDELGSLYDQFNNMLTQIQHTRAELQAAHDDLESRVEQRTEQLSIANDQLTQEVHERVRAEKELEDTHEQLMAVARRAGMAEIATGVLHNVGNVLNSVNVSANLACDRMRQIRVDHLQRATGMLSEHVDDFSAFVSEDTRGKQLIPFFDSFCEHLAAEQKDIVSELEQLNVRVNHVKVIVATQQSYAGVSGVLEDVDVASAIDDAVKLNATAFERHRIKVIKQFASLPKIKADRQKLLQILVNLVKNAKDALVEAPKETNQLVLQTAVGLDDTVEIRVIDNGCGIPLELQTRIFSHGFTTKRGGHGFGLHSCANAAREMGGTLNAISKGSGQGATFVLQLPIVPRQLS